MKPREQGGVVDERLNVYGVQNLKIAGNYPYPFLFFWARVCQQYISDSSFCLDCSITPDNVGANTYNTAIAIGEKAAVIIAEDLGIKGVLEGCKLQIEMREICNSYLVNLVAVPPMAVWVTDALLTS